MKHNQNIQLDRAGKSVLSGALRGVTQSGTALLILLMPKCSICLAAYLNIFSLMGLSVAKYASWILPVLSAVILVSIGVSFSKARKLNDYRAFALLLAGSVVLLVSKIWVSLAVLNWIGFAMVLTATVVQLLQSRRVCGQDIFSI